jgi:hypothetical protein
MIIGISGQNEVIPKKILNEEQKKTLNLAR